MAVPFPGLKRLSRRKQKRLDLLMAKNNDGQTTAAERRELQDLVRKAETIALANARVLACGGTG